MSSEPRLIGLNDLWGALWDDLRRNATGKPSGDAIIGKWRVVIEGAVRAQADTEARVVLLSDLEAKVRALPPLDARYNGGYIAGYEWFRAAVLRLLTDGAAHPKGTTK